MKKFLSLPLAALAGCMAEAPPADLSAEAESRLAAQLEGRVAGPPQSCVRQQDLLGNESVGEGAIVFRARTSGLVYVNRPAAGCPEIRAGRALVTRTTMTQLCRGDIAEVIDPVSGISYGACGLGDFTPYRRVR